LLQNGGGVGGGSGKWGGAHLRPKGARFWAPPPQGVFDTYP